MSDEMKLPDACRYAAQNTHKIDRQLLIDAATELERLQSILRLIAIHSDDPDISRLARVTLEKDLPPNAEPPTDSPAIRALFDAMDDMEKENRTNDICICGHPRSAHIGAPGVALGAVVCGRRSGSADGNLCPCRQFQKRSEPGE